jgi:hypothetical protein
MTLPASLCCAAASACATQAVPDPTPVHRCRPRAPSMPAPTPVPGDPATIAAPSRPAARHRPLSPALPLALLPGLARELAR